MNINNLFNVVYIEKEKAKGLEEYKKISRKISRSLILEIEKFKS